MENNNEIIQYLLYSIPNNVDYTEIPSELDDEDIDINRVLELKKLILIPSDYTVAFQAALLLCNWGYDEGFIFLNDSLLKSKKYIEIPNRLYGYNEAYTHMLGAIIRYWAIQTDKGNESIARLNIFPSIIEIIKKSNQDDFMIDNLFWVVLEKQYYEYLPYLEEHLFILLDNISKNKYRIELVSNLLIKINPIFVEFCFNYKKYYPQSKQA